MCGQGPAAVERPPEDTHSHVTATFEGFKKIAGKLSDLPAEPEWEPNFTSLDSALSFGLKALETTTDFVGSCNGLPAPGPDRDKRIVDTSLPLAIYSWASRPPEGNAALLHSFYKRVKTFGGSKALKIAAPDWLRGSIPHLQVAQVGDDFPGYDPYISRSRQFHEELSQIRAEIAEKRTAIQQKQASDEKTTRRGNPANFTEVIAGLEEEVRGLEEKIPPLFELVPDVDPEEVTEALAAIHIKVSLKEELIAATCEFIDSLEKVIIAAADFSEKSTAEAPSLKIPVLVRKQATQVVSYEVKPTELKHLHENPSELASLTNDLIRSRSMLADLVPTFEYCETLSPAVRASVFKSLAQPLSRAGSREKQTMLYLLNTEKKSINESIAALMTQPILTDEDGSESFVLEDPNNAVLHAWAISLFLRFEPNGSGPNQENLETFEALLKASTPISEEVFDLAQEARQRIIDGEYEILARFLNKEIEEQLEKGEPLRSLALLLTVAHCAEDKDISAKLRHQIPHLEGLKKIGLKISENAKKAAPFISRRVHAATRGLGSSMADYSRGPQAEELMEFLKTFRFYMEHPDILQGVPGNEGMKSGMLLVGLPGVGKTFFVECLKNELNIELFSISPDEKDNKGESIADIAKKTN